MPATVQSETARQLAPLPESGARPALYIPFLDGLRAVTALYIVLYHAQMWRADRPFVFRPLNWLPLNYGHAAVCIFVVLSGFGLALAPARRGGALPPFGAYMLRRAKRILPPYYAALAISLLVLWLREILRLGSAGDHNSLPVTTANVAAHLLLIHNWSADWITRINGPMWFVAVEWQLYWLFPLIFRSFYRVGMGATLIVCAILGSGLHFLPGSPLDILAPWYCAPFAFGAAAAVLTVDPPESVRRFRGRIPWGPLALATFILMAAARIALRGMMHITGDANEALRFAVDPLFGLAVAFALVWLAQRPLSGPGRWALRVLEWRPLVALGLLSYSLYLLHGPILDLAARILIPLLPSQTRDAALLAMLTLMPLLLALVYLFHRMVERPSMRRASGR